MGFSASSQVSFTRLSHSTFIQISRATIMQLNLATLQHRGVFICLTVRATFTEISFFIRALLNRADSKRVAYSVLSEKQHALGNTATIVFHRLNFRDVRE